MTHNDAIEKKLNQDQIEALGILARRGEATVYDLSMTHGRYGPGVFFDIMTELLKTGFVGEIDAGGKTALYYLTPLSADLLGVLVRPEPDIGRARAGNRRLEIQKRIDDVNDGVDDMEGLITSLGDNTASIDMEGRLAVRFGVTSTYLITAAPDGFSVEHVQSVRDVADGICETIGDALKVIRRHRHVSGSTPS